MDGRWLLALPARRTGDSNGDFCGDRGDVNADSTAAVVTIVVAFENVCRGDEFRGNSTFTARQTFLSFVLLTPAAAKTTEAEPDPFMVMVGSA